VAERRDERGTQSKARESDRRDRSTAGRLVQLARPALASELG
jgi:hypothetical protein